MKIDKNKLPFKHWSGWISMSVALDKLDEMRRFGSITELEYRWRVLFWTWGAARFEGTAGALQDRCYDALGLEGVDRRMQRVSRLKDRYVRVKYGEWLV